MTATDAAAEVNRYRLGMEGWRKRALAAEAYGWVRCVVWMLAGAALVHMWEMWRG